MNSSILKTSGPYWCENHRTAVRLLFCKGQNTQGVDCDQNTILARKPNIVMLDALLRSGSLMYWIDGVICREGEIEKR